MDQKTQLKVLRDGMAKRGIEEHELSAASGVSYSLVTRYNADDPKYWVRIGPRNAPKLAEALGTSIAMMLYGKDDK